MTSLDVRATGGMACDALPTNYKKSPPQIKSWPQRVSLPTLRRGHPTAAPPRVSRWDPGAFGQRTTCEISRRSCL
jgi:hypothetical protein